MVREERHRAEPPPNAQTRRNFGLGLSRGMRRHSSGRECICGRPAERAANCAYASCSVSITYLTLFLDEPQPFVPLAPACSPRRSPSAPPWLAKISAPGNPICDCSASAPPRRPCRLKGQLGRIDRRAQIGVEAFEVFLILDTSASDRSTRTPRSSVRNRAPARSLASRQRSAISLLVQSLDRPAGYPADVQQRSRIGICAYCIVRRRVV
jgi:hypothetical protein